MVKNVFNGLNLVEIGHFWRKWSELGHFLGVGQHMSKFGESSKIMFHLKVSKIYFSMVLGHKYGQECL